MLLCCIIACNKKSDNQTIITGETNVLVDETLQPIIEDQIMVFESKYNAKIKMKILSENEIIAALTKDTSFIAVMSRNLSKEEIKFFETKKIKPRITPFAKDAVAFITNKKNKDTLLALADVINFMKGNKPPRIRGLVFDNPNSSTVRIVTEVAGVNQIPEQNAYALKNNNEVIKFVAENENSIGVVGLNWLYQNQEKMETSLNKIAVMHVKGIGGNAYIAPTQNNIAEGTYPLARDLFIINCQGTTGLGMGFSSFISGEIGQRIILKSGLLPVRIPGRKLLIKK